MDTVRPKAVEVPCAKVINYELKVLIWVSATLFSLLLGLVGVVYSSIKDDIKTKANNETVILMQQKIEVQLDAQNKMLEDVKKGVGNLETLYWQHVEQNKRR